MLPDPFVFNLSQPSGFLPSWLFTSGGWSIRALASVFPMMLYSEMISFRIYMVWSPCCSRDSQELTPPPQLENTNSLTLSLVYGPVLTCMHTWLLENQQMWLIWTIVCKRMSLLFNMLSWFVIHFLPRIKSFHNCNYHLQGFWSPRKENVTIFNLSWTICHEVMRTVYHDLHILNAEKSFRPTF